MYHEIESHSCSKETEEAAARPSVLPNRKLRRSQAVVWSSSGADRLRLAFFIHGTPGAASDWSLVWEELDKLGFDCETLCLDRPGFGENEAWKAAENWEEQIDCFESALLPELQEETRLVLVGHSYGAALALGLAERFADDGRVAGLVLVSGVLSPREKQRRWYHRALLLPLVSRVAPQRYVQSAREMSAVAGQLSALDAVWRSDDLAVSLIHGDEDSLIPLANSEYARERFGGAVAKLTVVPGGGHALTRSHASVIAREIVAVYARIAAEGEVAS